MLSFGEGCAAVVGGGYARAPSVGGGYAAPTDAGAGAPLRRVTDVA